MTNSYNHKHYFLITLEELGLMREAIKEGFDKRGPDYELGPSTLALQALDRCTEPKRSIMISEEMAPD